MPAAIILLAVLALYIALVHHIQKNIQQEIVDVKNAFFVYQHENAHKQQRATLTKSSTVAEELSEYEFHQMMKRWRKGKM